MTVWPFSGRLFSAWQYFIFAAYVCRKFQIIFTWIFRIKHLQPVQFSNLTLLWSEKFDYYLIGNWGIEKLIPLITSPCPMRFQPLTDIRLAICFCHKQGNSILEKTVQNSVKKFATEKNRVERVLNTRQFRTCGMNDIILAFIE